MSKLTLAEERSGHPRERRPGVVSRAGGNSDETHLDFVRILDSVIPLPRRGPILSHVSTSKEGRERECNEK